MIVISGLIKNKKIKTLVTFQTLHLHRKNNVRNEFYFCINSKFKFDNKNVNLKQNNVLVSVP